jgi:hypothetical protein
MSDAPQFGLKKLDHYTQYAPLVALGFYVRETDLLSPLLSRLQFPSHLHTQDPAAAVVDIWVSILAGCRSISQVNTKIRPDLVLAQAWGRPCFCEQSTLARVLDACRSEQVQQLRAGVTGVYRWLGRAPYHPWGSPDPLLVDIDLTGLPAGRQAEGSTRGYFSEKKGPAVASFAA